MMINLPLQQNQFHLQFVIIMNYHYRPNENSLADMEKADLRNLQIFQKHLKKQISLQQQIQKNYQLALQSLQAKKKSLINLIQQSLQTQDSNKPENHIVKDEMQQSLSNKPPIKLNLIASPQNLQLQGQNKSILMNRSRILSRKEQPKQNSINYMANINEYKHKDLAQQVGQLLKQLNSLANKSTIKQMNNSSLLMQSKYQNTSGANNNRDQLKQQQQFCDKYLSELGQLQRLPVSTPSDANDEVLCSLMNNLQKQQQKLIQNTYKYQKLQVQKMVKQNLQEKTIQNMRLIYKEKKKLQSFTNVKEVKSSKDIVKFGYTDKMLNLIQQKTGFKEKLH